MFRTSVLPRVLGVVVALFAALAAPARADDAGDRAAIMRRYVALKMAMALQDVAGVAGILAPEFQLVDVAGVTKDSSAVLDGVRLAASVPGAVGDAQIETLRRSGRNVVLVVQNVTQVRNGAQNDAGGPVELRARTEDEWTPRRGAWYLLRSQTRSEDLYVNGALISHRTPPSFE